MRTGQILILLTLFHLSLTLLRFELRRQLVNDHHCFHLFGILWSYSVLFHQLFLLLFHHFFLQRMYIQRRLLIEALRLIESIFLVRLAGRGVHAHGHFTLLQVRRLMHSAHVLRLILLLRDALRHKWRNVPSAYYLRSTAGRLLRVLRFAEVRYGLLLQPFDVQAHVDLGPRAVWPVLQYYVLPTNAGFIHMLFMVVFHLRDGPIRGVDDVFQSFHLFNSLLARMLLMLYPCGK